MSLCQKLKLELKTDVKAEVVLEARQSLFAAVVQAKYARGLVVSDFERCKGFCSGEGSLPFLHCVNCFLVWYMLESVGSVQFLNPSSASHALYLTVEKAALGKISVKPGDCEVCGRQLS